MKVQKYYKVTQGIHDNDGKYHEFGGFQRQTIQELLKKNLATEITKEKYNSSASWGSGHYTFIDNNWICNSSNWDSSG